MEEGLEFRMKPTMGNLYVVRLLSGGEQYFDEIPRSHIDALHFYNENKERFLHRELQVVRLTPARDPSRVEYFAAVHKKTLIAIRERANKGKLMNLKSMKSGIEIVALDSDVMYISKKF